MAGATLLPIYPTAAQSTRVLQTTYEGAVFILDTTPFLTRAEPFLTSALLRLTAATAPVTISLALYQRLSPRDAVFTLVASGSVVIAGGGAQNVTIASLPAQKARTGECIVIVGRSSAAGTATLRTYGTQNYDGLAANVPAGNYPSTFQTALLANAGPPATLNPLTFTPTTLDVGPVLRLI